MESSESNYKIKLVVHDKINADAFANIVSVAESTGSIDPFIVCNHVALDLDDHDESLAAHRISKDAFTALNMCKEIEAHPSCAKPGSGCVVCGIMVKSILTSEPHVFNYCKSRVGHLVGDAWSEAERARSEAMKWVNEEMPIKDFLNIIELHKKNALYEPAIQGLVPEADTEYVFDYLTKQVPGMLHKIDRLRKAVEEEDEDDGRSSALLRQIYVCGRLWRGYMHEIEPDLISDSFLERFKNSEELTDA